ncbi:MAG: WecB/TagA/CpsF family glycosyltransferase [Peptococcaceae bacterium]|jgi:N-acetylglucosaminyldiphosphoundecaprenol N-acetyl-beta-D-mannosaminyltransferase|nr:WecB/TagA/CpsF family glycosyltransferase [Peptococcaceae bacterium]
MKIETVSILGVRVARMSMEEVVEWIGVMVEQGKPRQIVTANAEIIYRAYIDKDFHAVLDKADLVTADGAGVVLAGRLLGTPFPGRVTGIDLVYRILELAEKKDWGLYFLGASRDVVEKAVLNVLGSHPKIRVCGYHHGYFSQEETAEVVSNINRAKPDILLVGMGVPRQETFIRENIDQLKVPVSVGVGGSFDILAGTARRAPEWMQRRGLEWLYRLCRQPSRIRRMMALPRFVLLVLLFRLKNKK